MLLPSILLFSKISLQPIRLPWKSESSWELKGSVVLALLTMDCKALWAKFVTVWDTPETYEKRPLSLMVDVGLCPLSLGWLFF